MVKRVVFILIIPALILSMVSVLSFAGCKTTTTEATTAGATTAAGETTAGATTAAGETTAAAETTAALTPKQGGTLNYGIESEIPWMDPHITFGGSNKRVVVLMFEGLVAEEPPAPDKPVTIVPKLATSWDISTDGLTYTFHLREGVKFHDGTPFNADAVAFNIKRIIDPTFEYFDSRLGGLKDGTLRYVTSVKVIDDSTIDIILSKPWGPFLTELASSITSGLFLFLSPESIKKWGNEAVNMHPVGTGPFMFSEYVPGVKTVLVKNPNYWNQPFPYLDKVNFYVLSEVTTRTMALQSGDVDMITEIAPDQVKSLEKAGFKIVFSDNLVSFWFYAFNLNEEHMKNVLVRQAINYAIDREGMASSLLQDTVYPLYSMIPHTSGAYDPNDKPYEYNPEKAKELLKEAGYPNGFTFTLQTPTGGSTELIPIPMAEWVQRNLADVGIKMKIVPFDWVTYLGYWVKGMTPDVGMNQMSWGTGVTDYWAANIFGSKELFNTGHINDPIIDSLLAKYETEPTEQGRIDLAKQIFKQSTAQAYHVPICTDKRVLALNPKVEGVISNWFWSQDFSKIWIKE